MRRSANHYLRHSDATMTTMRQVMLTLGFSMMLVTVAAAQQSLPTISVKSGVIRNLQEKSSDLPKYASSTEVQLDSRLATVYSGLIAISGAFYVGYWNDGISKISKTCIDCITYSYRSYTAGMRFYANPHAFPLDLFTGLSYHFIRTNYVGGRSLSGQADDDFWDGGATLEAGIRIVIPVVDHLAVNGEVQTFIAPWSNSSRGSRYAKQPSVKLGVSYSL